MRLIIFNLSFERYAKKVYHFNPFNGLPILDALEDKEKKDWEKLYKRALGGEKFNVERIIVIDGEEVFFEVTDFKTSSALARHSSIFS